MNSDLHKNFYDLLSDLEGVNNLLLEAFKQHNNDRIFTLLNSRATLSDKIQNIGNGITVEMDEPCKEKSARILKQDEELLIYLELEVQKLKGKYKRLSLINEGKLKKAV